jgi:gluconokinase
VPVSAAVDVVLLMGVAGCGKTTVGAMLAERWGATFLDGDGFHPIANVQRMAAGVPLTDADRRPWLESLAAWIGEREAADGGAGANAIVTCSALKRSYRDLLRAGHPSVWFVHLVAPEATLGARLRERRGHYMPPALLASQIEALEPLGVDEPGALVSTDAALPEVVQAILAMLEARGPGAHPV